MIYSKIVPMFSQVFLDFMLAMIEEQCLINLCSYSSKIYSFLMIKWSSFLAKERMQIFVYSSILFCLKTVSQGRRGRSSNFLIFQTSEDI